MLPTIVVGLAVLIGVVIVFGVANPPTSADHAGLRVRVGEVVSPANPSEGRARRTPWWLRRRAPILVVHLRPEPQPEPAAAAATAAAERPGPDWPRAA